MNTLINFYKFLTKSNSLRSKILFSSLWLLCFIPLNINPEEFQKLPIISKARLILPLLIVFFSSIFLIKNFNTKKKIFIILPFFYFFLCSLFVFFSLNYNSHLNLYWGFAMFISYLYIFLFVEKIENLKSFLLYSLFALLAIFVIFTANGFILLRLQVSDIVDLYSLTGAYSNYENDITGPFPRSSGLARMGLLLYIAVLVFLFFSKNRFALKYRKFFFVSLIILGTITLSFQSRTINFIYLYINILLTLIIFRKKLFEIKKFLLIAILPLIFTILTLQYIKYSPRSNKSLDNNKLLTLDNNKLLTLDNSVKLLFRDNPNKDTSYYSYSSNRFENWEKIFKTTSKNIYRGYGFQSDKKIINQSAHNVYMYALICGGIISLFLVILISLRCIWTSISVLYKYYFQHKKIDELDLISILFMFVFLLRSILETSYGVYSIDFLFFIICFLIIESNYKLKKIIK